jgi:hypothetical protein
MQSPPALPQARESLVNRPTCQQRTDWLDDVAADYPFPIAWTYRQLRADLEGHRGDRDGLRQLVLLKDCVETLVKYLALVTLAARLDRREPPDALDRAVLEMLVAPSLGTWSQGILRRLVQAPGTRADHRLAPLVAFATRPFFDLVAEFTTLRNRVLGHGLVRDPREDRADVNFWLPRLNELLAGARFLAGWELVQAGDPPRSWMGADAHDCPAPAHSAGRLAADTRPGEFLLVPGGGPPLSLHPFVCLLGCPGCGQRDRLFLYDSQKQYTPGAKRVAMLENAGGHKEAFEEPARGLAERFDEGLLLECYRSWRSHFEVLEGKLTEFDFNEYRKQVRDFVGRRPLLEQINAFVRDPGQDRGYFLLVAEPGLGKTAVLTYWIDHNDVCPLPVRFFWRRGRNLTPFDFLRHVYHGLLRKHRIEDQDPPRDEKDYPRKLDGLLKLLSDKYLAPGECEVIVVDGLDEAGDEHARRSALEAIPRDLPRGIYFLLSSRPVAELDVLRRERGCVRYELAAEAGWNRADVADYLRQRLGLLLGPGQKEELLPRIEAAAAGNFLWAKQFCDAVQTGRLPVEAVAETLPRLQGLDSLYGEFWLRLLAELSAEDRARLWRVAAVLSVARTALTAEQICRFTGLEDGQFVVLRAGLQQYLDEVELPDERDPVTPVIGFRLYHASFTDFLLRQPGLVPRRHHERIVRSYLGEGVVGQDAKKPQYASWDRYGLSFVAYHAAEACDWQPVIQLVRTGFLEAKADRLGDVDALVDARLLAGLLAEGGEGRWDDLVTCAYAYCKLAERVRDAPAVLEAMIRQRDFPRALAVLETQGGPTGRVELTLAASVLLEQSGETTLAARLWREARGRIETEPIHPLARGYSTYASVRATPGVLAAALLVARDRSAAGLESLWWVPEEAPEPAPPYTPEELHQAPARARLPVTDALLAYLGSETFLMMIFFGGFTSGLGWLGLAGLLALAGLVLQVPGEWTAFWVPCYACLCVAAGSLGALFVVLLPNLACRFVLLRWRHGRARRVFASLAQALAHGPPVQRAAVLQRAMRFHSLLRDEDRPREQPWTALMAGLVARQARDCRDDQELLELILAATGTGDEVCDSLGKELLRRPPADVERVYRLALGRRARIASWWGMLRLTVHTAARLDAPDLLVEVADLVQQDERWGRVEQRVIGVLKAAPPVQLARAVLLRHSRFHDPAATQARKEKGLYGAVVGALKPGTRTGRAERLDTLGFVGFLAPVLRHLLAARRDPLCRGDLPFVAVVFAAGCFLFYGGMYLLLLCALVLIEFFSFLARVVERTHDREQVLRRFGAGGPPEPEQLERFLEQTPFLTPLRETQRVKEFVLARKVLRGDYTALERADPWTVRNLLVRLRRAGVLPSSAELLRQVWRQRTLLDAVAGLGRGGASGGRPVTPAEEQAAWRRALPLASAWCSLAWVLVLSVALVLGWLGALAWLLPAGSAACLLPNATPAVLIGAAGFLAVMQHIRLTVKDGPPLKAGLILLVLALLLGLGALGCGTLQRCLLESDSKTGASDLGAALYALWGSKERRLLAWWCAPLYLLLVPVLITNLLVPECIARWRGAGLLYPTPAQLWRQRILCSLVTVAACFLLALFAWLFL